MIRSSTEYLIVHASATQPRVHIGAKEIREWHKAKGWRDIGYQFVIQRDGTLEAGRALEEQGAHVKGYNHISVGICMVGGIDRMGNPDDNFTDEQWAMLQALMVALVIRYPTAQVLGHRDFSPDLDGDGVIQEDEWMKACPCFDVVEWWATKKEEYLDAILKPEPRG